MITNSAPPISQNSFFLVLCSRSYRIIIRFEVHRSLVIVTTLKVLKASIYRKVAKDAKLRKEVSHHLERFIRNN